MIDITLAHRICEHLDKYVYDRIWNEPYSEYRTHVVPIILNNLKKTQKAVTDDQGQVTYVTEWGYEPISGSLRGRYSQIQLPVETDYRKNKQFYVYSVPRKFFRSVGLDVRSWTLLSDFCNSGLTEFDMFTTLGEMLWRGGIYLRQADKNDCILLAVDAAMFDKCTSSNGKDPSKVIFGKYHDSDSVQDNLTVCTKLQTRKDRAVLEQDETMTFYAGRLVCDPEDYSGNFAVGGYVESRRDLDVIGKLTIPVTTEDAPIYTSSTGKSRLLVHIPKTLNTDNLIITPNTCDIFVFPKRLSSGIPRMRGFYLYTAGRGQYFHQITHNDFSIDMELLNETAVQHGFTDGFYLHVLVRTHSSSRVVVRDTNYIDLLYSHNDEDIVKFLTWNQDFLNEEGHEIRQTMTFWAASHLEQSLYADALVRRRRHRPPCKEVRDENGNLIFPQQCDACGFSARSIGGEVTTRNICTLKLTMEYLRDDAAGGSGPWSQKHGTDDPREKLTEMICPYFSYRGIEEFVDILGYYHVLSLIAKRVTHLELTAKNARNFTVGIPLALSNLDVADFYPVVYHNGKRIPCEYLTIANTDSSVSEFTKELTFNGSVRTTTADPLTPEPAGTNVIPSVYCKHMKITVDKSYPIPFNKGDKVVIELFDNFSDDHFDSDPKKTNYHPRIQLYSKPEVNHILTDDIQFDRTKIYYHKNENEYVEMTQLENKAAYDAKVIEAQTNPKINIKDFYYPNQNITGDQHFEAAYGEDWEQTVRSANVKLYTYEATGEKENTVVKYKAVDMSTVIINTDLMNITIPAALLRQIGVLNAAGASTGKKLLFVEGPTTIESTSEFHISEVTQEAGDDGIPFAAFGTLGRYPIDALTGADKNDKGNWITDKFPYDTTVAFLNGERLVRDLDYYPIGYSSGNLAQVLIGKYRLENSFPHAAINVQNVEYLTRTNNKLSVIRSDVTTIKNFHGFLTGNVINWGGEDPFWFDGLSTLVVGGRVCSNFVYSLGAIRITDMTDHRNGAPYEIWTAASSQAIELLGDWHRTEDEEKLIKLQRYFGQAAAIPLHTTIIPHSHKIYSVYLEKIIDAVINQKVGTIVDGATLTDDDLIAAFKSFEKHKSDDVVYNHIEAGHADDLRYVDIYPVYHRLRAPDRPTYTLIARLVKLLSPVDKIQHRDANNNNIQHKKEMNNE